MREGFEARVRVSDSVSGEHELGPCRMAMAFGFYDDGEYGCSVAGSVLPADLAAVAHRVGVIAGVMAGDDGERRLLAAMLASEVLDGASDVDERAGLVAASAGFEMGATS